MRTLPGLPPRALAALVFALLAGCTQAPMATSAADLGPSFPDDPITLLIGEIHVHQFPMGSHAWAAFVADPVPVTQVDDDELYELDTAVTATAGSCTLWRRPLCEPDCTGASYCFDTNVCRPIEAVTYVDGGPITITGSQLYPTISLDYTAADTDYASVPPPGNELLFNGGELLNVEGGVGQTRLGGTLPAPMPVLVSHPDLTAPFHIPASGDLDITWNRGDAVAVVITLSASTTAGDYANIRCVGPDNGSAAIPAALIAGMPAAPRDNRLEVERDNEVILRTVVPGRGMYSHAAFSAWVNGSD